jgi:hypothetical protein
MSEKSDAKAKAEARRAKILAKEGSRLQLAKGETVIVDVIDRIFLNDFL